MLHKQSMGSFAKPGETATLRRLAARRSPQHLYSLSADHLLTPGEIELSLGLPSWSAEGMSGCSKEMQQCVGYDFASLPFIRAQKLAGNGMHAGQLGAFYGYVLSRCMRRCVLERLCPSMPALLLHPAMLQDGESDSSADMQLLQDSSSDSDVQLVSATSAASATPVP